MPKTAKSPRMHSKFTVRTSAAKMPNNCWGRYVHVGVVERWQPGHPPSLSDNSSQCVRAYKGRLFCGTSNHCAAARAADRMLDVAHRLQQQYTEHLTVGYEEHITDRQDEI